jgi:hypothetical protein
MWELPDPPAAGRSLFPIIGIAKHAGGRQALVKLNAERVDVKFLN